MPHPIVEEEQALLAKVSALLAYPEDRSSPSERPIVEELQRLRQELCCAKGEDRGSILEQYHAQISLLEQLRSTGDRPAVNPSSPYFAHLRLREEIQGVMRERDICIGRATRLERGLRIVDWRHAPVSKLFYQYAQGDEYEEEMGGRLVSGQVTARRTVVINGGDLQAIHAPEGIFQKIEGSAKQEWESHPVEPPRLAGGEGSALRWHRPGAMEGKLGREGPGKKRRRDKHLPDIAGLIDPEQFDLITRPEGFLVVRGSAGSGKTTVALHRIAWLAHGDGRVDSPRTLFLVFSRALRDYVGHVLPALGLHHVQIRTFRDWALRQRERHFPRLPGGHREDTPAIVVALKSHPSLLWALSWQINHSPGPSTAAQAFDDWINTLTNPVLLAEAVAATAPGAFSIEDLRHVSRWCATQHDELLSRLESRDARVGLDGDLDGPSKERGPLLDEEDDSLLLHAWQLRVGPLLGRRKKPLRLLHVAIDEVQDFSPVDIRVVLGCLDRRQSITLAGDTQQHVMRDAGFTSWADFFRHLDLKGVAIETLQISYRCTRQIIGFSMDLLGPLREDEPPLVTRSGPRVEFFSFTDHGATVAFLAQALRTLIDLEDHASVALLTPSRELSNLYYQGLVHADLPRLRLVSHQKFSFAPGIEVTEISEVKGLEFDYVVLIEASAARYPDTPTARRLLHVGATRAIHQLWLTSVARPSPLITGDKPR